MARLRDEQKRLKILTSAKFLFAHKGFTATSITDIVKESGLPVGSIYTYFKSKDDLVRAIVDEGWTDIRQRLQEMLAACQGVSERLKIILDEFLPELFDDVELISILLSEAIELTRIEEKVEELSTIIYSIIQKPLQQSTTTPVTTPGSMRTALVVYFLGILGTVRIARTTSLGITNEEILQFIRQTITSTLNIPMD